MALNGIYETPEQSFERFHTTADSLNMILLCPKGSNFQEGYVRLPVDDRENISLWWDYLNRKFKINRQKSVLVGFSRGGSIATEMGLYYPSKFKNIVCIFGFFSDRHRQIVSDNIAKYGNLYYASQFYFITGENDVTEPSLTNGSKYLLKNNINVQLKIYDDLSHSIPSDIHQIIRAAQPTINLSSLKKRNPISRKMKRRWRKTIK